MPGADEVEGALDDAVGHQHAAGTGAGDWLPVVQAAPLIEPGEHGRGRDGLHRRAAAASLQVLEEGGRQRGDQLGGVRWHVGMGGDRQAVGLQHDIGSHASSVVVGAS